MQSKVWTTREQETIAKHWQTLNERGQHAPNIQDARTVEGRSTRLQALHSNEPRGANDKPPLFNART